VIVDQDLAVPMYVAIVADTGSFNYGKTTRHTHEVAGRLIEAGVDPLAIHGELSGNRSLQAVHAGGAVLRGLQMDASDPRVAHATMTVAQYNDGGADALEMLDLVNQTIALAGVRAGALFIEAEPSVTRLSLRSKGVTSIVEVAQSFGGGGHRNAAGATIPQPVDVVRERVLQALREAVARQHGPR
jgi:phosphoesterase RecJ-like protein